MAKDKDNSSFSMLDLFRTEVSEQGKVLTDGLLALEANPTAADRLEELMRAAHSIKGAARLVGVEPVVRLAHVAEDAFVAAQNSTITLNSIHVDVLLSAVDKIISISELTENEIAGWDALHGNELDELVNSIAAIKSGEVAEKKTSAKTESPEKNSSSKKAKPVLSPLKRPAGKGKKLADADIKSRGKINSPATKAGEAGIVAQDRKSVV